MKTRQIQFGFTLLEALIVVAVAAIMAVVAIPGMTQVYLDNRRAAVVNDFFSAIQIARSEAITRNQRVAICATANQTACGGTWSDGVIVFEDIDRNAQVGAGEPVLHSIGAMPGTDISSSEFPTFVVYRPNGRVMTNDVRQTTGDIEVCDHRGSKHSRVVIIDTSGRPRVSKVNSDGAFPSC